MSKAVAAPVTFTASARRLGIVSACSVVLLGALYGPTLAAGLVSLSSPQQAIGDPWFGALELLILLMAPLMVALAVAVHAWAGAGAKVYSLVSLVFTGLLAGLTSGVHFVLLAVGRQAAFAGLEGAPLLLSFQWPSLAYALDILAWDVFFALAALFAAPVFGGSRLAHWIRGLLVASGVLALAGLAGVVAGDMRLRNIGIVGYAVVYPVAVLLMARLFQRTPAQLP